MNIQEIFKRDLRAHDYIKARGLSPEYVSKRFVEHECIHCKTNNSIPKFLLKEVAQ